MNSTPFFRTAGGQIFLLAFGVAGVATLFSDMYVAQELQSSISNKDTKLDRTKKYLTTKRSGIVIRRGTVLVITMAGTTAILYTVSMMASGSKNLGDTMGGGGSAT